MWEDGWHSQISKPLKKKQKKTSSAFSLSDSVLYVCWCLLSGCLFSDQNKTHNAVSKAWPLSTSKVHLSLCWGLWLWNEKKLNHSKANRGKQNQTKAQGTEYSGVQVTKKKKHTTAYRHIQILTSVAGGSSVSCSITGTAETVPSLFTTATVFTVIRHTPGKRTRERTNKNLKNMWSLKKKEKLWYIQPAWRRWILI